MAFAHSAAKHLGLPFEEVGEHLHTLLFCENLVENPVVTPTPLLLGYQPRFLAIPAEELDAIEEGMSITLTHIKEYCQLF